MITISDETKPNGWVKHVILFLVSQAITLFGSAIVQMAMIWHVALDTSSGLWVTLLTLSAYLPQMIISFFSGAWADRLPRKKLIVAADLGIAGATLVLALAMISGRSTEILPFIILVSIIRSLGSGIQTPAVNALLPQLVPEEHLIRLNSLNSSVQSVVQFAAPLAAGVMLRFGPISNILLVDVVTAVIGVAILMFVKVSVPAAGQEEQPEQLLTEIKAGIRYVLHDKQIFRILLTFGIFIFFSVPSGFLAVLMIERTFGAAIHLLTIAEMAGFAGMVTGGLALGIWGGFKNRYKTLSVGLLGYAVCSVCLGLAGDFRLFSMMLFLISVAIPVVQSSAMTLLQENTEPAVLGRVFGLMNVMYTGFMPLGMAVFGPLADFIRIQSMVIACSGILLLLALTAMAVSTKEIRAGKEMPVS